MDYHRDITPLRLREYGRNVQRMVELLPTIADAALREQMAHEAVRVMAIVATTPKEVADFRKKLWDHLQQIADYNLPVTSPLGQIERPPADLRLPRMAYQNAQPKLKQYGRNIELMIERATSMEPGPARDAYVRWLATYMKLCLHNRGGVHTDSALLDQQVWDQLFQLSKSEVRPPADVAPLMNAQSIINRTPISNASVSGYQRRSKKAAQRAKMKDKFKPKRSFAPGGGQGGNQGGGQAGGQQGGGIPNGGTGQRMRYRNRGGQGGGNQGDGGNQGGNPRYNGPRPQAG